MNKSEIIKTIDKETSSLSKADIKEGVDSLINFLIHNLYLTNRIEVRGFGSFSIRHRQARLSRNPKTGTSIAIDSRYHTYFRASKLLKRDLNE